MKIIKYFFSPRYRFNVNSYLGFYNHYSDKKYIEKLFYLSIGKFLNLDNPKTFNEKLQWLKLYNQNPKYTKYVDKYLVREYVKSEIGDQYLIPILGVWKSPEQINFDKLPNQFVLKCNHNSGLGMYICKDKNMLTNVDIMHIRQGLCKGLKQNYYLTGREWPYKNVPRKIIAEKYLIDHKNMALFDYKVHVFNGRAKFILVCSNRFSSTGVREDFYDREWNHLEIKRPLIPNSEKKIAKPHNLELMLVLAEKLAKDIPFVRVDFYEVDGQLKFGEMTFFPASGFERFEPEYWDIELGGYLKLPLQKVICKSN